MKCNEIPEYGLTPTLSYLKDGSVITKAFRQIAKHSCHSRLGQEIVLGSSKWLRIQDLKMLIRLGSP
jgi:hypothetical protein